MVLVLFWDKKRILSKKSGVNFWSRDCWKTLRTFVREVLPESFAAWRNLMKACILSPEEKVVRYIFLYVLLKEHEHIQTSNLLKFPTFHLSERVEVLTKLSMSLDSKDWFMLDFQWRASGTTSIFSFSVLKMRGVWGIVPFCFLSCEFERICSIVVCFSFK